MVEFIREAQKEHHKNNKQQLIETILSCTASRREARSYLASYALLESNDIYKQKHQIMKNEIKTLQRFNSKAKIEDILLENEGDDIEIEIEKVGVGEKNGHQMVHNRGYSDYISKVLEDETSIHAHPISNTTHPLHPTHNEIKLTKTIRSCVIRLKFPNDQKLWNDDTLQELGKVLRNVLDLGASPVIVLDNSHISQMTLLDDSNKEYLEQAKSCLRKYLRPQVSLRIVEGCYELVNDELVSAVPAMIAVPVFSGVVPLIIPTVVDMSDMRTKLISGGEMTKHVVNTLCQLNEKHGDSDDLITVEKIVFVDELGGVPSLERGKDSCHVLINLQQEYDSVVHELSPIMGIDSKGSKIDWIPDKLKSEKLKSFMEMKEILQKLPDATGIMTTPYNITKLSSNGRGSEHEPNPLIYSILTDRATQSSSLPIGFGRTRKVSTTIIKWGVTVNIFTAKNLIEMGLESCVKPGYPLCIDIEKLHQLGKIDLSKINALLEDSFRRKFDWGHYMNRIQDRVAGVILTGEYEAGAIVTYEPVSVSNTVKCSNEFDNRNTDWIAYLDKFAVLRAQQGEPGLADVVFKAMQSQFPAELVWRSRKTNPVNKWYFERSVGTVGIENSQWRVFYTGWKAEQWNDARISQYVDVCRDITPSFVN
ncbi:acetyl-CoA:L-glutamate N-acetyltransferase [Martiniozyma asiatica (nom. inval.)]|nr:acetyl-CoA:L-glutamate N-acetyltransferase [Martiniozyma asiatica]